MTKSEIEKLIEYLQSDLPKLVFNERYNDGEKTVERGTSIYCKVTTLFDVLRDYPVESGKIIEDGRTEIRLFLYGDVTPLNLAKAIVDSELLTRGEISEISKYLDVYFNYHSDGGYER